MQLMLDLIYYEQHNILKNAWNKFPWNPDQHRSAQEMRDADLSQSTCGFAFWDPFYKQLRGS